MPRSGQGMGAQFSFRIIYLVEISFCLSDTSFVINSRLGQIPVMAANNETAAGKYSSQFTVVKPVKYIPVQSIQLKKAKKSRSETEAFMMFYLAGWEYITKVQQAIKCFCNTRYK